jgi:hypothetical protein
MVYLWSITLDGTTHAVKAAKTWTAVSRVLHENPKQGTIRFIRLANVRRVRCAICGHNYEDNAKSKDHHFNRFYYHKKAVEEQAQKEKEEANK